MLRRLSCAVDTIRKIEAGRRRPSRQLAELLAVYFSVPPDERTSFMQWARGIHDRSEGAANPPLQKWEPVDTPSQATGPTTATVPPQQANTATTTTSERSSAPVSPPPPRLPRFRSRLLHWSGGKESLQRYARFCGERPPGT